MRPGQRHATLGSATLGLTMAGHSVLSRRSNAVPARASVRIAVLRSAALVAPALWLAAASGCAARGATPAAPGDATAMTAEPKPRELVAIVDGQALVFGALRAALVEDAGAQALRDAVVDQRLAARLRAAGLSVGSDAIARERTLLLEALDADAARAEDLLRAIRLREGLGPARFDALLARNAGLRALIAGAVTLDEAGLASAHDILHGPKRTVRIAVLASLADAERFRSDLSTRGFSDLAVERSLDESAARGGLLAPLARRDPSYPEPLRAAAFATPVGETSPPVLDGARFHLVRVESERASDAVTPAESRAACERWLRLSRERLLMDALARELASMEGVTVFDRAFDGPAGAR